MTFHIICEVGHILCNFFSDQDDVQWCYVTTTTVPVGMLFQHPSTNRQMVLAKHSGSCSHITTSCNRNLVNFQNDEQILQLFCQKLARWNAMFIDTQLQWLFPRIISMNNKYWCQEVKKVRNIELLKYSV